MPAPTHVKLIGTGVLGPKADLLEEFSFGVSAGAGAGDPPFTGPADMLALATAVAPHFTTFVGAVCTNQVELTNVRAVMMTDEGFYARTPDGAYVLGDKTPAFSPGGGTALLPFQTACAISLDSAFDGASGRGRFYAPVPQAPVQADGRMLALRQSQILTAADAFIEGLNSELATLTYGRVSIASSGSLTKGIPAALYPVTAVRVGMVLDTQRRRRGNLEESYATAAIA